MQGFLSLELLPPAQLFLKNSRPVTCRGPGFLGLISTEAVWGALVWLSWLCFPTLHLQHLAKHPGHRRCLINAS